MTGSFDIEYHDMARISLFEYERKPLAKLVILCREFLCFLLGGEFQNVILGNRQS